MKKAMRYAAAATACVLLTGCASENSTGLVRFFKEDYFEQTTTTQTTTAPETSATTQTTAEPPEIEPVDIPTIDIDNSGDTVTIYSFTGDINTFLDGWEPLGAGVAFEKIDVESYYSRLDSMLKSGKGDIDIFVVDQDHLPKYISSGYVLPIDQIGDVDTSEMYYSTIQDCTYENGIRALPLSLNPGVFLYNRTVARNALGTDDPGEVQRMISDWESFKDTARAIQSRGYKMTPNFTDMFRAFSGEAKRLTDEDGEAFVNQNALEWADTARTMYQSGLCDNNDIWTSGWAQGFTNHKYLGMFACNWLAEYTLPGMDSSGDWAICRGPNAYSWDNNYVLISSRSDNMTDSFRVIQRLCIDGSLHYDNGMIIPNNRTEFRDESGDTVLDSLGGQKPYGVYNEVLNSISTSVGGSEKDLDRADTFVRTMTEYITGHSSMEEALAEFYSQAR